MKMRALNEAGREWIRDNTKPGDELPNEASCVAFDIAKTIVRSKDAESAADYVYQGMKQEVSKRKEVR